MLILYYLWFSFGFQRFTFSSQVLCFLSFFKPVIKGGKDLLICEGYSVSLIFIEAVEYFEVSNIYQVISFMQTRKEDERKKIINYL